MCLSMHRWATPSPVAVGSPPCAQKSAENAKKNTRFSCHLWTQVPETHNEDIVFFKQIAFHSLLLSRIHFTCSYWFIYIALNTQTHTQHKHTTNTPHTSHTTHTTHRQTHIHTHTRARAHTHTQHRHTHTHTHFWSPGGRRCCRSTPPYTAAQSSCRPRVPPWTTAQCQTLPERSPPGPTHNIQTQ